MNDLELARHLELAEMKAWSAFHDAAPPEVVIALGLRTTRIGSTTAYTADHHDTLLFHRCLGLGLSEPATPGMLDHVMSHFSAGRQFMLHLSPFARPSELGDWLRARGFASQTHWVIWHRDMARLDSPPCHLRIERIGADRAAIFGDILGEGFGEQNPAVRAWVAALVGRPGWSHYLAYDEERPVGCAVLWVDGELAWLGWGATLRSHRGRGAQSAMLAARVRDALDAGCRTITVETAEDLPERPNPSYRNVARAGFLVAYLRPTWVLAPREP